MSIATTPTSQVMAASHDAVTALIHEIHHALGRLAAAGETHSIDLRALPLAPGDEQRIEDLLGSGEIEASLESLGRSEFRESRYPGVWLVTHRNADGQILGRLVEIAPVPALLVAPPEDVQLALRDLGEALQSQVSDGLDDGA